MEELKTIETYQEFKKALDTELYNQAEGFVRTGYLLKVARDTDILRESGYATVAEFAQAEYGLSKDIVSRYIAINDRYSKDGYSEFLQEKFEGYGVAKLQEMLTLPDSVVNLMSPEMTKREIQDIKKEIKEEEQISDIEVCCEGTAPDQEHMTTIQKAMHQYFYEQREEYIQLEGVIRAQVSMDEAIEKVLDVIAPSGIALKAVRVQGIGKLLISFKGKDNDIEMLNVRNNEKEDITWQQFIENLVSTFGGKAGINEWEMTYGEPFEAAEPAVEEEKPEVAPVQPKRETKVNEKPKAEKAKPANVHETENHARNEAVQQQQLHDIDESIPEVVETQPEEEIDENRESEDQENGPETQIEGQTSIEEMPEVLPDVINTECESKLDDNTLRGYKAAVTHKLARINELWEGDNQQKARLMLIVMEDMRFDLERLQKAEEQS